jgi:hypothetical protein
MARPADETVVVDAAITIPATNTAATTTEAGRAAATGAVGSGEETRAFPETSSAQTQEESPLG